MKFCVYTRAFYEVPYLNFFIEHYIYLGFCKIIILKSDNIHYDLPPLYSHIVDIHLVSNEGNELLPNYQHLIKNSDYDWILSVDIDEFLMLNAKYKNITDFTLSKLAENNNINMFYFRWGMIEKYDTHYNYKFINILKTYKIYANQHVKTMFKRKDLLNISSPHYCDLNTKKHIYFENNILYENKAVGHPYTDNTYNECILIHLHTRSIENIIIKSIHTELTTKKIISRELFIDFINNIDLYSELENALETFKKNIGLKSILPFFHCDAPDNIYIYNYGLFEYIYEVTDTNIEQQLISFLLYKNNIDKNKYYYFINALNNQITKECKHLFYK